MLTRLIREFKAYRRKKEIKQFYLACPMFCLNLSYRDVELVLFGNNLEKE